MSKKFRARVAGRGVDIKVGFALGAAANTNITITGIKPGDQIISMLNLRDTAEAQEGLIFADVTSTAKITAANTVQNTSATNGTAKRQILVIWASK